MLEKKDGNKVWDEKMTRRQFLKISGKGLAGVTISASMLSLFGCTTGQVRRGQVATWATPRGLLVVNAGICTDCQRCETNCTTVNDGYVSTHNSRIKMTRNLMVNRNGYGMFASLDDGGHWTSFPDTCRQCADPPCGKVCPTNAVYSNAEGVKLVDADKCISCRLCIPACPWQMPVISTLTGKMVKCNSCGACIEGCPSGALRMIPWTAVAATAQREWRG